MATPEPSIDNGLRGRLASVLPKNHQFDIYHLSTPPTKTDALYSAPPGERPDRTYCENHFLAVSIDVPPSQSAVQGANGASNKATPKEALVLGVEIQIYSTSHATTLFVSKADSTGYLHLLNLPKGTPSPIREVCAAFIQHLVEKRKRKDVQFIVSLFARSQDQYLFPGSIEYSGKHVLDDRGLVKWWCRVLNPLIESSPKGSVAPWKSAKGYLIVPGLDKYETRAFVPRAAAASSWSLGHPLESISHYCREFDWVPPRCLIPRFPDDPKSRFRDELDEEADKSGAMQKTGSWKSVKTLDMFWEMMAYRQECSSGRMTGFIWVVFDDVVERSPSSATAGATLPTPETSFRGGGPGDAPETPKKQRIPPSVTPTTTPRKLFPSKSDLAKEAEASSKTKTTTKTKKPTKKLKGQIKSRQPRVKTEQRNYLLDRPISTAYYYWPQQARGERIFSENDYKRIVELLLRLDFANLDKALSGSHRWITEVGMGSRWGYNVTGTKEAPLAAARSGADTETPLQVNNLSGLIKRKRSEAGVPGSQGEGDGAKVNILSSGLVKKKIKEEHHGVPSSKEPEAVTLAAGLVRKKPDA